jgi:hypothetical protein
MASKLPPQQTSVLRPGAIQTGRPDRSIAGAPPVSPDQGQAQTTTEIKTYFTTADGKTSVLYNGDRLWAKVTLVLETAGPVVVGNQQNLGAVLSGGGELLETGIPMDFVIAKKTRLYIASTSINRVKFKVEPLPWMEQITGTIGQIAAAIAALVTTLTGGK